MNWESIPLESGPQILLGATLALLGRRLFWLCVGGAGFLAGLSLGTLFEDRFEVWAIVALSLVLGVAGAIVALFLQRFAVIAFGVLSGAYIVATVGEIWDDSAKTVIWVYYAAGGLLGALFVGAVFEWALMILSALAGALLIADSAAIPSQYRPLTAMGAAALGFAFQASRFKRTKTRAATQK